MTQPHDPRRLVRRRGDEFQRVAYAQNNQGKTDKIVVTAEADFGARNVYSVQFTSGAADSAFGHALERMIARLALTSIAGQPSAALTTFATYSKPACRRYPCERGFLYTAIRSFQLAAGLNIPAWDGRKEAIEE